ncbi:hypothetical protein GOM44_00135 [Wolbachia endosymbiont of Atemnus politus]|uniref:hypothetical protein n=1 Tax=Wolbachia endosymbiont of Atemnus politus TaxID=2682840 RepID=UPI0015738B88|nr:hypothetical protein [Wolbachia endosymbiont of Atemnus politus]NSX82964.1 hypothetical protein [Wolbachia endosymbiont of Atemnus politus]
MVTSKNNSMIESGSAADISSLISTNNKLSELLVQKEKELIHERKQNKRTIRSIMKQAALREKDLHSEIKRLRKLVQAMDQEQGRKWNFSFFKSKKSLPPWMQEYKTVPAKRIIPEAGPRIPWPPCDYDSSDSN